MEDRDDEVWDLNRNEEPKEKCALVEFFKQQAKLPPSLRSTGAYLVCHCKKCISKITL